MSAPRDIIGMSADSTSHSVSSRGLARTMRNLHSRQKAPIFTASGTGSMAANETNELKAMPASPLMPTPAPTPDIMETRLEADRQVLFRRPWNRLESGMRLAKIREYATAFSTVNRLTEAEQTLLQTMLHRAHGAKLLGTKSQIEYSPEQERILVIYGLHELKKNDRGERRFGLLPKNRVTTRRRTTPTASYTATRAADA